MNAFEAIVREYLASGDCPPDQRTAWIELLGHPQGMQLAAAEVLRQAEEMGLLPDSEPPESEARNG